MFSSTRGRHGVRHLGRAADRMGHKKLGAEHVQPDRLLARGLYNPTASQGCPGVMWCSRAALL